MWLEWWNGNVKLIKKLFLFFLGGGEKLGRETFELDNVKLVCGGGLEEIYDLEGARRIVSDNGIVRVVLEKDEIRLHHRFVAFLDIVRKGAAQFLVDHDVVEVVAQPIESIQLQGSSIENICLCVLFLFHEHLGPEIVGFGVEAVSLRDGVEKLVREGEVVHLEGVMGTQENGVFKEEWVNSGEYIFRLYILLVCGQGASMNDLFALVDFVSAAYEERESCKHADAVEDSAWGDEGGVSLGMRESDVEYEAKERPEKHRV